MHFFCTYSITYMCVYIKKSCFIVGRIVYTYNLRYTFQSLLFIYILHLVCIWEMEHFAPLTHICAWEKKKRKYNPSAIELVLSSDSEATVITCLRHLVIYRIEIYVEGVVCIRDFLSRSCESKFNLCITYISRPSFEFPISKLYKRWFFCIMCSRFFIIILKISKISFLVKFNMSMDGEI